MDRSTRIAALLLAGALFVAVACTPGEPGAEPGATGSATSATSAAGQDASGGLPSAGGDLGEISFPTSASGEAQERFLRGVLLLHSFEYDRAAEAFRAAQKADRNFVLAYWGEAMTYDHPLWNSEDAAAARGVLDRLAPSREARLALAPTPRERMYLEAVEALYGMGNKTSRDLAYRDAMRRLSEAYPDDLEAKAFYALSLLGSVEGRDHATYMRAAALAEEVYQANPRHPGAVHYLIHAYDDPVHAPLGLRPARAYAALAPAAVHARHMPSHIFLALGMWEDVIESNRASSAAARELGGENYHALHWLMYAHLQKGQLAEARRVLGEIGKEGGSRYYLARARANFLVDTERWEDPVADLEVDVSGQEIAAAAEDAFADGLVAVKRGDTSKAREALAVLRARRLAAEKDPGEYRPAVEAARIMEIELEGLVAIAAGDRGRGLGLMRRAAEAEDAMAFEFGPPMVAKPTRELLGDLLLEADRPAEAAAEYRRSLERAPRRARSVLGLARSLRASGDEAGAAEAYGMLARIWAEADPDWPALAEVRTASAAGAASTPGVPAARATRTP